MLTQIKQWFNDKGKNNITTEIVKTGKPCFCLKQSKETNKGYHYKGISNKD